MLCTHVAHHARLDAPGGKGGEPARAHLESALRRAKQGRTPKDAERVAWLEDELRGPECPDALRHVLVWSNELYGRSGVGLDGFAPLTFSTIADWAALTDRRPTPDEVTLLLRLDAIRRHPPTVAPEED